MFKADDRGFLVGELVDTSRELLAAQHQSLAIWRAVRSDVAAIARAMGVQSRASRAAPAVTVRGAGSAPSVPTGGVVTPTGRGGGRRQAVTPAQARGARSAAARAGAAPTTVVQPRAANGRFVKGGGRHGGGSGEGDGDEGGKNAGAGMLKDAAGRLSRAAGAIGQAAGRLENVDATVAAGKEVADVVAPLGRGLSGLLGRNAERKKERWYRRFWKALTSPVFAKRTEKPSPAQGPGMLQAMLGGMFGGVGGLLSKVPSLLMTVLSRIFLPLVAVWGAWNLGQWIGGKINEWLEKSGVMTKVFDAFDAIGEAFDSAWNAVTGAVDTIIKTVADTWTTITDTVKKAIDGLLEIPAKIGEFFSGLDEAIRGIPVIGAAYGKAVDALKAAAAALKKGYTEGESGKPDGKPAAAAQAVGRDVGQVVKGAKDAGAQVKAGYTEGRGGASDAPVPSGILQHAARSTGSAVGKTVGAFKGSEARAFETGKNYAAGNIGGLDDANTRALVASTALTESGGGKLDIVNSAGYMGRYQAGASWLADAGLIKGGSAAVREAMKRDGYTSEYKWGQSGGMTRFLKDDANWNNGLSYDKYLGSAETQDKAFKTNSDRAYADLVKRGAITEKTSQAEVAGLLKARHIAGLGGAITVSRGGTGASDANGTSARKYYNDLAQSGGRYVAAYNTAPKIATANVPPATPPTVPPTPADEVPNRLNSWGGNTPVQVSINDRTTQEVSNRRIAVLASGGISAA